MAHVTDCPACGAPLEYSGDEERIRCRFCATELEVDQGDGEPGLRVYAKPSPQDEVIADQNQKVLQQAARTEGDEEVQTTGFEQARGPGGVPEPPGVGDEGQVSPGQVSSATIDADADDLIPGSAQLYETPVTIPETPAYQAGREPVEATGSGRRRLIGIGLAIFFGVVLLCACAAGVFLIFQISGSSSF